MLEPETIAEIAEKGVNPYVKPETLEAIHSALVETPLTLNASKHFYDINF